MVILLEKFSEAFSTFPKGTIIIILHKSPSWVDLSWWWVFSVQEEIMRAHLCWALSCRTLPTGPWTHGRPAHYFETKFGLDWASLMAQMVKNLPAMQETWVWTLGWEDSLEKGMATHTSILAWRIPWTEEPGRLQPMGSQTDRHDWMTKRAHARTHTHTHTHTHIGLHQL